jgi:hypothetical protein
VNYPDIDEFESNSIKDSAQGQTASENAAANSLNAEPNPT